MSEVLALMGKWQCPLFPAPASTSPFLSGPDTLHRETCPWFADSSAVILPQNKQTNRRTETRLCREDPINTQPRGAEKSVRAQAQPRTCLQCAQDGLPNSEGSRTQKLHFRPTTWVGCHQKNRFKGYTCLPSCTPPSSYCIPPVQQKGCD